MKEFLKGLIEAHIKVLNALLKRYCDEGGDVSALGETCPTGYYWNETQQKCVLDVGQPE